MTKDRKEKSIMRKIIAVFIVIGILSLVLMTTLIAEGRTIIVGGAGTTSVNGTYDEMDELYELKPCFNMIGIDENYYIAWTTASDPHQWTMSWVPDVGDPKMLYYNTQDTYFPPKTGWETNYNDDAVDPPPTLSGDGTLPDPITVNNAGSEEVRGEYVFDEVVRGKHAYHKDADLYRIVWVTVPDFGVTETGWYMSKTSPPTGYYFNPNDWGVEPPANGWTNAIVVGLVGLPPMPVLTGDVSLPVELSAFTADFINNTPTLYWETQSETDNLGWNIYRNVEHEFNNSEQITHEMIPGNGTTTEPSYYNFEDAADLEIGQTYYYWLECIDYSGIPQVYSRIAHITIPDPSINPPNIEPPIVYDSKNVPNPIRSSAKFQFTLDKSSMVAVSIYNILGELVQTLPPVMTRPDETAHVYWNGKDANGRELAPGIYFYNLMVNGKTAGTKKLILMK